MSALPLTITTAGLAALINANNTGASAMVIDALGLSATAIVPTPETSAIPAEIKRIEGVAGVVVADDTIHVSVYDRSADTYSVRTVALYLADGTLFGLYSQPEIIVEKATPSSVLLDADVRLTAPLAANIEFTGGGWINPPASESVVGVLRLATAAEALAGVDHTRAITPATLKAVLTPALAGKAAVVHPHGAGDVTSGVFALARIPDLPAERITGLTAALAAKAPLVAPAFTGGLTVSDGAGGRAELSVANDGAPGYAIFQSPDGSLRGYVGWRSFSGDRLVLTASHGAGWEFTERPTVNGALVWDAASFSPTAKSDVGHGHGLADVAGLSDALAGKAALSGADFYGAVAAPRIRSGVAPDHGFVELVPGDALRAGYVSWRGPDGAEVGWMGWGDGDGLRLGGPWDFAVRPTFAGSPPWDATNFNPAAKADVGHGHGVADVVGLSDALAGKASAAHTHAAADTVSGVFALARIPDLSPEKITGLLDQYWPAGEWKMFARTGVPSGVRAMVADGSAVSRAIYARLYAAIGTTFGAGDGVTTFNLPDWRGLFQRGLDLGRGLDPGRTLGSYQESQNLAHTHGYQYPEGADNGATGIEPTIGWTSQQQITASSGGAEARPINHALLSCITF